MNIGTLRAVFGSENLGNDPPAGQPRVTALALRSAINPDPIPEADQNARQTFGCASNATVMQLFLKVAPIMNQFCVYNCNAGVFSGRFNHLSVIKMTQLLSAIRLINAGAIQDLNRDGIALLQAYAMAELFGPYIPAESRLEEANARRAIIDAVHHQLHAEERLVGEDWFHVDLGLGDSEAAVRLIARENMTINQALVILEAWSATLETSREWLNGISMLTCLYTSLAKQGSLTQKAATKIVTGVKTDHPGYEVFLPERTVRVFYNHFARLVTDENAQAMFTHYTAIIPQTSVRILTLIEQAADSGMTVFTIIRRALNEHQDWQYWRQAIDRFPVDFTRFVVALQTVGQNRYFGFRRNLGVVAANNFKSLGYLSQQILIHLGGDDPLGKYMGLRGTIPGKTWIDEVIRHNLEMEFQLVLNEAPSEASAAVMNQIIGLMAPA